MASSPPPVVAPLVATALVSVLDHPASTARLAGRALMARLLEAGHPMACWTLMCEDEQAVRAELRRWVAAREVRAVIATGDGPAVVQAVEALRERTLATGADVVAGVAQGTRLFALRGSAADAETAWSGAIAPQLARVGRRMAWPGAGATPAR